MKLAYIAQSSIPSKEANSVHVMKMCQSFSQAGNEVTLFVPNNRNIRDINQSIHGFYGVEENFEIKRIPFPAIPKIGVAIFGLLSAIAAKVVGVDVVYGRSSVGCYMSTLLGHRVAFETHTPIPESGLIGDMTTQMLYSPNLISLIVITDSLRRYFERSYPNLKGDIVVAPDGADPIPENSGEEVSLENNSQPLQVGYVGHLYDGKGMELVVDIAPDCPFAHFHIVGGTEEDIEYWSDKVDEYNNIIFYGYVPHSEAVNYLSRFDVVLAPYQSTVKGTGGDTDLSQWMSPLKIFEYMAAGRPILCSDLPVLREVLTDGETAVLLDPQDRSAWIEELGSLAEDESKRADLGEKAKKEFELKYTWEARAKQINNILSTNGL